MLSGDRLLLGGKALVEGTSSLEAEGDITIEKGVINRDGGTIVETAGGNVTVGPKASFPSHSASFAAPGGNITFLAGSSVQARTPGSAADITIVASGHVELVNTKLRAKPRTTSSSSRILIQGSSVMLGEKVKIKSSAGNTNQGIEIVATSGDLLIDSLSLDTNLDVSMSGENVTIGAAESTAIPRSSLTKTDPTTIEILATDAIRIENLTLSSGGDASIETTGTFIEVLGSLLKGRKATPTVEIGAGPGSTCDLTGTAVLNATLVTTCDAVVGP